MRQSTSFNKEDLEWACKVFSTLQRGGDARDLMRAKPAAVVVSKFTMMRLRVDRRATPRDRASLRDDLLTAQVAGLRWILGFQEIGRMVGVHPSTLRSRELRWRARVKMERYGV